MPPPATPTGSWSWTRAGSPPRASTATISPRFSASNGWQASGVPHSLRRRIGDHRGEIGFRNDPVPDQRPAGELADGGALLDEIDLEPKQHAGLDRQAELRAVDRHEINQLAGAGE